MAAGRTGDDDESSSEETHESMPELIPVPSSAGNEPEAPNPSPVDWRAALTANCSVHQPCNKPEAAADSRQCAEKEVDHVLEATRMKDSNAWFTASETSVGENENQLVDSNTRFEQRKGELLAAIDKLVTLAPSTEEAPSLEALSEAPCQKQSGGLRHQNSESEGMNDVVISAAAARKAQNAEVDDFQTDLLDDSESEDADGDDGGDAETPEAGAPRAKHNVRRKAKPTKLRSDLQSSCLPPGVPAPAPASNAVLVAASAVSGKREEASAGNGVSGGGVTQGSFGPRFRGLPLDAVRFEKSRWKLHSLAEVPRTSSAQNRQTASEILDELRNRGKKNMSQAPRDKDAENHDISFKPTFKRPVLPAVENELCIPQAASDLKLDPGTFVAVECATKICPRLCAQNGLTAPNSTAPPVAKRARMHGVLSFTAEGEEDGGL